MARFRSLLLLCVFLKVTLQVSLPSDKYYYAGVVEMPFAQKGTAEERLEQNLKNYLSVLTDDSTLADILVFPESTLNSYEVATIVPDPTRVHVTPCDHDTNATTYHNFLVKLSCEAKRLSSYLVINLTEKEKCQSNKTDPRPCASNGLNIYNTNVVFDRKGTVISRYRKVNLYGEAKNTTYLPEFGIFDTDFGVKFGHFICFDILFYTPAQEMAEKYDITDFIYPTMWFSQLPFLTAVQFQAAWSYGNDVNLLAAGSSEPSVGTTGTGIYNGRNGILEAQMSQGIPTKKLFIHKVPKYDKVKNQQKLYINTDLTKSQEISSAQLNENSIFLKRDYLEFYQSMVINLNTGTSLYQDLCFKKTGFCCHFEIEWSNYDLLPNNTKYYTYRLGIFDGWRKEEAAQMNKLRNCALFTCTSEYLEDCGKTFSAEVMNEIRPQKIFERILISGLYPTSTEFLLMPNSLKDDLMPLNVKDFEWTETQIKTENGLMQNTTFLLKKRTDNLLTFAIYGNYYNGTDYNHAASIHLATFMTLLSAVIIITF